MSTIQFQETVKQAGGNVRYRADGDDVIAEYERPNGMAGEIRLGGLIPALVAAGAVRPAQIDAGNPLSSVTVDEAVMLLYAPYDRPAYAADADQAALDRLDRAGLVEVDPTAPRAYRATEDGELVRAAMLQSLSRFHKLVCEDLGLDVRRFRGAVLAVAKRLEPRP